METFFAILFSSLLVLWILRRFLKNSSSLAGKLPPGPVPAPLVGSLFKLGDEPHRSLAVFAATYGPLMSLRLGQVTTVVVSSAAMAKKVLQRNDQSFAGRSVVDAVRVLGHEGASMVWLQPGQHWRRLRSLCNTCIFSSQRLDASQGLRRRKVEELLAHVSNSALSGKTVDIGKVAFVTILNLISNTVFSVDMVDIDSQTAQEFKDLVWAILEEAGKPNLVDCFPILRPIDPQGIRRRMRSYLQILHDVFEKEIQDREVSRSASKYRRRNDFLDALLDQKENGAELSRIELKSLFADLFVAGSDTSSDTLEWAMAELLRNPEAMARARSELGEIIGKGKQVEESDVCRLPYLQAIVKETLRLHPPAPFLIPHRAECDVEISGYTIPKHTKVIVNVWAIARDSKIWADPTCFKPERFLGSKVDYGGQHFELIPFGAGRRICPGLPLAFRMVHLLLASLLHSFCWTLPDGMGAEDLDMKEKFGITLQKSAPLVAVPLKP
ncbi:geraniol 8-hydroxylase-like isoform X1 [Aristolochia californica]|uniref:geraniol 8-hydroxylase-like isoform X1 n=1 Tax=Aristolochia californica TaxID=171875 RepID=UPI0035DD40C7